MSPETILNGGGPSADVWSFGIILLELCIGKLWTNLKPGPIMRRILTLTHAASPAERIARENDLYDNYKVQLNTPYKKSGFNCLYGVSYFHQLLVHTLGIAVSVQVTGYDQSKVQYTIVLTISPLA